MKDDESFNDKRNFWLLVTGASIFQFGWIMPTIVRIPYFNWLGMSSSQIGLTGFAWGLCIIGNFLCPSISRRFPRKKWFQFIITLPYLFADLFFGISIVVAYIRNDYSWLIPVSLFLAFLWPFAAGWYVVPLNEYIANCISKTRINSFVTTYQLGGAVMGFAGALLMTWLMGRMGTPYSYAFGFLFAFGVAFLANLLPLLAHETPVPQPAPESFWKPAINAVKYDSLFFRFLAVAFMVWFIVLFPQLFMQMFAIREMGMPDKVAAIYGSAYTGATMVGAALTGYCTRKLGYINSLLATVLCFIAAMLIFCLPWSSELRADSYKYSWMINDGAVINQKQNNIDDLNTVDKSFIVSGSELKIVDNNFVLRLEFSKNVSAQSFNGYDINFKDPQGKRLQVVQLKNIDMNGRIWETEIKDNQRKQGEYLLTVTPYVLDTGGNNIDMNGNRKSAKDHYRFILVGILYGFSFIGLSIVLESLMYLFAPIDRRAGYFAAFRIIQFAAPTLAFYASGFCFSPGNYKTVFMILLICALLSICGGNFIIKPVRNKIKEFGTVTMQQKQA